MRTTCRRVFIIGMHNSKLTYQDMDVKGGVKTYQRGVDVQRLCPPKPESTEGGRRVSVLSRQEGAPVLLG